MKVTIFLPFRCNVYSKLTMVDGFNNILVSIAIMQ